MTLTFPADEDGEELAESITRAGLKMGLTPAQVWAMPVHHMAFAFFKSPERNEAMTRDAVAVIAEQNENARLPFAPVWFLTRCRA